MAQATEDEENAEQCARAYECKEVAVVAAADAIVYPHTVVVLSLNAVVAHSAMMASWWSPYIAGLTIFGRDVHSSIRGPS